ncbi:MAG: flagellar type III secretion system protein FliR [Alphaproteobacteria bacterium]|nr:flagellar type III secretion system protein FliR [Alphaproteobacteria bacterium]
MINDLAGYVIPTFLLFCRIGGCLLLVPGLASAQVPMQVRLFIALAVALTLAPLILDASERSLGEAAGGRLIQFIISETLIGVLLGLSVRVFLSALQFMTTAIGMYIGLGTLPGIPVDLDEPLASLSMFITSVATILFFLLDLHLEVVRGLVLSYEYLPFGVGIDAREALEKIASALSRSFLLVLQIGGPFLAYGLIVNLLFGLVNKMVPQIPAYFVSIPFLIAGGLFLLYFLLGEMMAVYFAAFRSFIIEG